MWLFLWYSSLNEPLDRTQSLINGTAMDDIMTSFTTEVTNPTSI